MKIAFGHLHYSPEVFWKFSLREWQACFLGYSEKMGASSDQPMEKSNLDQLMKRYPDQ